jgi:prepilin-type N-terminal cleavage/methylation domain-containing protein
MGDNKRAPLITGNFSMFLPRDVIAELRLFCSCTLPLLCKPTPWVQAQALRWLGWLPKRCHHRTQLGFTLAELLISLLIIGVLATFTIPKILVAQQNAQRNAIAKEMMSAISGTMAAMKADGTLTTATTGADVMRHMNYIKLDTTTLLDDSPSDGWGSMNCATWWAKCYKMYNGSTIAVDDTGGIGGFTTAQSLWFVIDPDSTYQGDSSSLWVKVHGNGWTTTDWLDRPNLEPSWFHL